jgi:hypothetical protein
MNNTYTVKLDGRTYTAEEWEGINNGRYASTDCQVVDHNAKVSNMFANGRRTSLGGRRVANKVTWCSAYH